MLVYHTVFYADTHAYQENIRKSFLYSFILLDNTLTHMHRCRRWCRRRTNGIFSKTHTWFKGESNNEKTECICDEDKVYHTINSSSKNITINNKSNTFSFIYLISFPLLCSIFPCFYVILWQFQVGFIRLLENDGGDDLFLEWNLKTTPNWSL